MPILEIQWETINNQSKSTKFVIDIHTKTALWTALHIFTHLYTEREKICLLIYPDNFSLN